MSWSRNCLLRLPFELPCSQLSARSLAATCPDVQPHCISRLDWKFINLQPGVSKYRMIRVLDHVQVGFAVLEAAFVIPDSFPLFVLLFSLGEVASFAGTAPASTLLVSTCKLTPC